MSLFSWVEGGIQKMRWFDMSLVKLTTAAFVLLIAKLWTPLLSLEWYWYLIVGIAAMIRPLYLMFTD